MFKLLRAPSSGVTRSTLIKRQLSDISQTRLVRFRYEPLDRRNNEIRLLTIYPATHDSAEALQCSLTHSSLDSRRPYHALSYAWRDDDLFPPGEYGCGSEDIVVNNARFRVGLNLAAALRARRSQEFCKVPLWVDAVCINQEETVERSGQILRMRDIYTRASKVIVWLGQESYDTEKAFRFIQLMYDRSKELDGWEECPAATSWGSGLSPFSTWFRESLISRQYSEEWHALQNLLRRAYWKRIWITQEILASKTAEFFCGNLTLDPTHLSGFLDLLVANGVMYLPLLSKIEGIILSYDTFSLIHTYLRHENWQETSLLQALYRTGMALSSEPRDKIYAVLNLAQDGELIVPNPDYALSVEKVYKDVVIAMARETGRLDFLSLANESVYPRMLDINLPTWVPDWTFRVTSTINSRIGAVKQVWPDRSSTAFVTFDEDDDVMRARGFIVDTIDGLAHCIGGTDTGIADFQLRQSTSHASMYEGWDAIDAIWRTLIANLIRRDDNSSQEGLGVFLKQCRNPNHSLLSNSGPLTFRNWYKHNQNLIVAGRSIKNWATDLNFPFSDFPSDSEGVSDLFNYRLPSHWQRRRFITTLRGFAGLAPSRCRAGDKICIILGCGTPIILREVDGYFEVVGECYLHGVMRGEAMVDLELGKYELQDFEVR